MAVIPMCDYMYVKYDLRTLDNIRMSMQRIKDLDVRAYVWQNLYAMVMQQDISVGAYLQIVLEQIIFESETGLIDTVMEHALFIIEMFLPLDQGYSIRTKLFDSLWNVINSEFCENSTQQIFMKYLPQLAVDTKHI